MGHIVTFMAQNSSGEVDSWRTRNLKQYFDVPFDCADDVHSHACVLQ
jgi:hypothetical protein